MLYMSHLEQAHQSSFFTLNSRICTYRKCMGHKHPCGGLTANESTLVSSARSGNSVFLAPSKPVCPEAHTSPEQTVSSHAQAEDNVTWFSPPVILRRGLSFGAASKPSTVLGLQSRMQPHMAFHGLRGSELRSSRMHSTHS